MTERGRTRTTKVSLFGAWWDANGHLHVDDLVERLGIKKAAIYNLRTGRAKPGIEVAAKIEALTGGKVTASSWVQKPRKR